MSVCQKTATSAELCHNNFFPADGTLGFISRNFLIGTAHSVVKMCMNAGYLSLVIRLDCACCCFFVSSVGGVFVWEDGMAWYPAEHHTKTFYILLFILTKYLGTGFELHWGGQACDTK
jgi:hypothetical protein